MFYISVNFDFCIMKKLWDLAHEKLVNILGGYHVGTNIHGCQPYLKIAIYVLKSANDGLLCRPLYIFRIWCPNLPLLVEIGLFQNWYYYRTKNFAFWERKEKFCIQGIEKYSRNEIKEELFESIAKKSAVRLAGMYLSTVKSRVLTRLV